MQEPYRADNRFAALKSDGSEFVEWLTCLNRVLCVAFKSEMSINNSPSALNDSLPEENRAICHFINASIPHKFSLCIGINPSQTTARAFFDAIKTHCCPGNCFEKLCVKLGVEANELKGLLAQAACHPPATPDQTAFNQLVTAAILAKGDDKPTSTFVGQKVPWQQAANIRRPPEHLVDRPRTPQERPPSALGSHYQRERVSQVQFVEHHAVDKFLIDRSASIHLSGSPKLATNLHHIHPFCIFFDDSNSSITITQMATLRIPFKGGNFAYSDRVLGTILSMGRLCRAGVFPFFSGLLLSLLVCNHLVTTTLHNHCWWMDTLAGGGTTRLAAETPSPRLFEMNPLSLPPTSKLSFRDWHFVQNQRAHTDWQEPALTFQQKRPLTYWSPTSWDHSRLIRKGSDAPNAILDTITHLLVQLGTMLKALQTNNAWEFVLANFTTTLANMGVGFYPSLPYSPQENSEAERLNRTLGDMARAMMTQSDMPMQFWQYAYASACYIHNRLPNSRCPNSSPHQVLYGRPPSIATLYPFGTKTIAHVPAIHQQHKLAVRGIEC
ncbi:hypothetical protein O181_021431 [Austropuccinia psidii MF-1]|uniref:Integrase catalytic domain-containing protein n=1 Tax=Austropuccinia psidii MF-1 TaxID=1389203 RepID=A0A9Q3CFG9_9BASI|nr:hypothetical protein [Austropuccinia psidii MF-1]